ncbi:hypothetical protein BLNAU_19029 [Blattamonas nauphoetae]|uniref:Uncharacterized protein n=1 Tax=Blattamonas nauphoetae TaxID=2049346 RepID=A0ABQ9X343_9EUKA|nr:hypothetical protein BLNAU_19029 [Blattamonas nauphoetae]
MLITSADRSFSFRPRAFARGDVSRSAEPYTTGLVSQSLVRLQETQLCTADEMARGGPVETSAIDETPILLTVTLFLLLPQSERCTVRCLQPKRDSATHSHLHLSPSLSESMRRRAVRCLQPKRDFATHSHLHLSLPLSQNQCDEEQCDVSSRSETSQPTLIFISLSLSLRINATKSSAMSPAEARLRNPLSSSSLSPSLSESMRRRAVRCLQPKRDFATHSHLHLSLPLSQNQCDEEQCDVSSRSETPQPTLIFISLSLSLRINATKSGAKAQAVASHLASHSRISFSLSQINVTKSSAMSPAEARLRIPLSSF